MLANGLANLILTVSPQKIILGGGVMDQKHLFPMIRRHVRELLNGYVNTRQIVEDLDAYIVPASFGADTGLIGALALANSDL